MTVDESTLSNAWRLLNAGDWQQAENLVAPLIHSSPSADALHLLAMIRIRQGAILAALGLMQQAARLAPQNGAIAALLGDCYRALGKWPEARDAFQAALRLNPHSSGIHYSLGMAHYELKEYAPAATHLRTYLTVQPNDLVALRATAKSLRQSGALTDAIETSDRILTLDPNDAGTHNNRGNLLMFLGRFDEAIDAYDRSLQLLPSQAVVLHNRATVLQRLGRLDEAAEGYRQSIALSPDFVLPSSGLLLCEQYRCGATIEELDQLHRAWAKRYLAHAEPITTHYENTRDPERPLRVGFVSGDLGVHPVGLLMVRMLEAARHSPMQACCFATKRFNDPIRERLQQAAHAWHQVDTLSEQQLAELIVRERIDILVDLTGHTSDNHLSLFARRPAPVQVTWLGYVAPTGVEQIDCFIADPLMVSETLMPRYRQRVERLAGATFCYELPCPRPEIAPLPALRNAYVTFGSFNNMAKVNREVVATWAEILRRAPTTRLLMKFYGLDGPRTPDRLRQQFADAGIDPARILLRGGSPYAPMLDTYNQEVDLALDTFPFSGGITSLIATAMGVPTVTFPGETIASRQTYAVLETVGCTETVARDRDDYVRLAVELSQRVDRLAELRPRLRALYDTSPLVDGPRMARQLHDVLRRLWSEWCAAS